ncbi:MULTISPECIES: substrate-binding domain-containing protein [unclassified Anabaena]|uniref:substrate-binding domain-containing protein n=1 Tax=unclassified Anabaena TaxID=2619674 RepID=UPI0039C64B72
MKKCLFIFAFSAIALLGLPSCSTNPNSTAVTNITTPDSNSQTAIKVGGSSSTVNFWQTLKQAYESTNKNQQLILLEPGQSENTIAGIKQGLVDVGAISKTLKPEENDGTLEFFQVVKDALLVATHPSVTQVNNLTTQDLQGIYSGSITNWQQLGGPDASIVVLDRPEDESAKRLLRQHYLGKDLPNSPNAVVMRKEGELIQTLQSTPHSIGAFSLAYAVSHNLQVNRLSLNGIESTPENLKAGNYPMVRTIGIVWSKQPSQTTKSFVDYILSQPASIVLEQAGFASVTQQAVSQKK